MKILKTSDFEKSFAKVPADAIQLYQVQEKRFVLDWKDSRLHIKKVKGLEKVFSFRVTRKYRVLFYFQTTDAAIFFDIDHRKDVYR